MLSDSNGRLAAARRLTDRRVRRDRGLFLAEGIQAVREAVLADRAVEIFATTEMATKHRQALAGRSVDIVSARAAASLSETVTPQGLVAVCRTTPAEPGGADSNGHRVGLAVILVDVNDPGNAGTILRTADAAGAASVIFAGDSVDPFNGKCVRASAGSVFHLQVLSDDDPVGVIARFRALGTQCIATSGHAALDLDELSHDGRLARPTAWIFGNEAHGLSAQVLSAADLAVRVPIYGAAESLNLSAAAAICLYASARELAGTG